MTDTDILEATRKEIATQAAHKFGADSATASVAQTAYEILLDKQTKLEGFKI